MGTVPSACSSTIAERRALLLERCRPGTSLLELPERAAYELASPVVARLNERPAGGTDVEPFAGTAARWADELPARWEAAARPFERELLDAAVGALRELPPTQGELVVCHQDCTAATCSPPSGSRGSRSTRSPSSPSARSTPSRSSATGRATSPGGSTSSPRELELDRERLRRWTIAHTVAWGFAEHEPHVYERQIDVARHLLRL